MEYFLRFEQWWLLLGTLPLVIITVLVRRTWHKSVRYRHTMGSIFNRSKATQHIFPKVFYFFRLLILTVLALLIGRPQLVDSRSNITVDGIDIMVVLDASGSMQFQDYSDDDRSRFEVAQDEARRFIKKRTNDSIGLVIFGKDAISRAPLTQDKKVLDTIIKELKIGDIDPDGTMLATAMVTGINRLKSSKAKSKVMILLTDGEPSDGDMNPKAACEIAKKFGIKIYTVGIGSDEEQVFMHPLYGMVAQPKVNTNLLKMIARETSGKFFMAHDAKDMRAIYETINELETTKHEAPLYSRYFEIYAPFVLGILALISTKNILSTFIWFGL